MWSTPTICLIVRGNQALGNILRSRRYRVTDLLQHITIRSSRLFSLSPNHPIPSNWRFSSPSLPAIPRSSLGNITRRTSSVTRHFAKKPPCTHKGPSYPDETAQTLDEDHDTLVFLDWRWVVVVLHRCWILRDPRV
jgi:hypothetical protein